MTLAFFGLAIGSRLSVLYPWRSFLFSLFGDSIIALFLTYVNNFFQKNIKIFLFKSFMN